MKEIEGLKSLETVSLVIILLHPIFDDSQCCFFLLLSFFKMINHNQILSKISEFLIQIIEPFGFRASQAKFLDRAKKKTNLLASEPQKMSFGLHNHTFSLENFLKSKKNKISIKPRAKKKYSSCKNYLNSDFSKFFIFCVSL